MSNPIADPGHGHSPAAWTAVIIMIFGVLVGTVAFFLVVEWLVWASLAVVLIGAVVGLAMSKAGYGVHGPKFQPKGH